MWCDDFVYSSVRRSVRDSHWSKDYRDGTGIRIFYENPGFYISHEPQSSSPTAIVLCFLSHLTFLFPAGAGAGRGRPKSHRAGQGRIYSVLSGSADPDNFLKIALNILLLTRKSLLK
jgi:hypothetical protein